MPRDEPTEDDAVYLWHITRAGEELGAYVGGVEFERFCRDQLLKDAVYWKIHVIGEAVGNLSESFRQAHDDIPWHKARAVRNRIIHGYDTIDEVIVWEVATISIPEMLRRIIPLMPRPPRDDED